MSLREVMSWDMSLWGREAGGNVYCACTDPVDSCPKAVSPQNKGVSSYIPFQAGYRSKKTKLNPHMAACDFISYCISPVLCDLHVSILLSFISLLCHLLPLSCHQNTACLFLFWPPLSCYIITWIGWCLLFFSFLPY
jgi:hypothetical protein